MDLTVGVVLAIIGVVPIVIWGVWWVLADLGESAIGSHSTVQHATLAGPRRRAA